MNPTNDNSGFTYRFFSLTMKNHLGPMGINNPSDNTPSLESGGGLDSRTVPRKLEDVKDYRKPVLVRRLVEKDLHESSRTGTGVLGDLHYWGALRDVITLHDYHLRDNRRTKDSPLSPSAFQKEHMETMRGPDASTLSCGFACSY